MARTKTKGTKIYAGSYIVGEVRGDTFYKSIAPNHFLKRPSAIAFDITSLEDAEAAGAKYVEVKNRETGVVFRSPLRNILDKGFDFNRGFGDQIGLVLSKWETRKPGEYYQVELFGV